MEKIPVEKRRRPREGEIMFKVGYAGISLTVDRIKEKISLAQSRLRPLVDINEEIGGIEFALGHAGNLTDRDSLEREIARVRAEKKKIESVIAKLEELLRTMKKAKEEAREATEGGEGQQEIMQRIERIESEIEREFNV